MLNKFDKFCNSYIVEGRTSYENKKFKVNLEKAKSHIADIGKDGKKHHHYINDKNHFESLLDDIDPDTVYTPKTFQEHIKSRMKLKGKPQIADGYSKLLFTFLNDAVESPFEEHKEEKIEIKPEEGKLNDDHSMEDKPLDETEDEENA